MNKFNWERAFLNLDINEMAPGYNTTIKNRIGNFIPHEAIICDDRDSPWINKRIKKITHKTVSTTIIAKIMIPKFLKN